MFWFWIMMIMLMIVLGYVHFMAGSMLSLGVSAAAALLALYNLYNTHKILNR
jgi:hypothetical protein